MHKNESHRRGGIYAKVIADSIANGIRLTTLELRFPRFILSQFNTHRQFSRNASSSRAIPVLRNIDAVLLDPAEPTHWGKNRMGMQATEELDSKKGRSVWMAAMNSAVDRAFQLHTDGYHKQIVNRILEPFSHIKVICTATEWKNFFDLRLHDDAQPEIKRLAECMKEAMDNSTPKKLKVGQWHLPYIDRATFSEIHKECKANDEMVNQMLIKCSVARCARVSFLNHDNTKPDIKKDIELHDRLLASGHYSPFEHCSTPMSIVQPDSLNDLVNWEDGVTNLHKDDHFWSGNFKGWIQYRQLIS